MLSQMCERLYFPIFLLSVGLFTLIYIDSLIVLAKLLSSLPIILKFSKDVSWPLILWCWNIGEGAFKCSLYLSPKDLPDFTNVLFPTVNASTSFCSQTWLLLLVCLGKFFEALTVGKSTLVNQEDPLGKGTRNI